MTGILLTMNGKEPGFPKDSSVAKLKKMLTGIEVLKCIVPQFRGCYEVVEWISFKLINYSIY